jgi:hypothetical protein
MTPTRSQRHHPGHRTGEDISDYLPKPLRCPIPVRSADHALAWPSPPQQRGVLDVVPRCLDDALAQIEYSHLV